MEYQQENLELLAPVQNEEFDDTHLDRHDLERDLQAENLALKYIRVQNERPEKGDHDIEDAVTYAGLKTSEKEEYHQMVAFIKEYYRRYGVIATPKMACRNIVDRFFQDIPAESFEEEMKTSTMEPDLVIVASVPGEPKRLQPIRVKAEPSRAHFRPKEVPASEVPMIAPHRFNELIKTEQPEPYTIESDYSDDEAEPEDSEDAQKFLVEEEWFEPTKSKVISDAFATIAAGLETTAAGYRLLSEAVSTLPSEEAEQVAEQVPPQFHGAVSPQLSSCLSKLPPDEMVKLVAKGHYSVHKSVHKARTDMGITYDAAYMMIHDRSRNVKTPEPTGETSGQKRPASPKKAQEVKKPKTGSSKPKAAAKKTPTEPAAANPTPAPGSVVGRTSRPAGKGKAVKASSTAPPPASD